MISCLLENCDYIVIEDADLKPQDLINHLKKFFLGSLVAFDMTKALGLTGNYAYVIWPKNEAREEPLFVGKRIW